MFSVLLVDRCYFSRFGLKSLVMSSGDLSVNFNIVDTDNLLFAREYILRHQPNIVMADFHGFLKEIHHVQQLASISLACGSSSRLILQQSDHTPPELGALHDAMGAWKILDKNNSLENIKEILQESLFSRPPFGLQRDLTPLLTLREEKILALWEHETSNENIASQMGISVKTVYTYKRNIRMKLGVNNRLALFLT